jgi:tight adherence protein B
VTALALLVVGMVLLMPPAPRRRLAGRTSRTIGFRRLRRHAGSRGGTEEVLGALRDELRAGAALRTAFERAVGTQASFGNAVAVSRMGGDVPAALRRDAAGDPLVLSLAALWQVCEGSGAALAAALDRLVEGAEQSARVRREVQSQLAGPRSTVRVLAALPVVGVGMGMLMGADPIGFLVGTPWGWGCLALATLLEVVGLFWMRRLVSGIESRL